MKVNVLKSQVSRSYFIHATFLSLIFVFVCASCNKGGNARTAFYYWKADFQLSAEQRTVLNQAANNRVYIRFFDVSWNEETNRAYPNAIVQFKESTQNLHIIPVIYMRNKVLEKIPPSDIDSLAFHCNALVNQIASDQQIHYAAVQVDCDWTRSTRDNFFAFLRLFKKIMSKKLEVTIRLHQVKYKQITGVPPADTGVLMFYNMGKLNANLQQENSIYNKEDAEKYIAYVASYPLPLHVALPVFSWAIQIREGRVIQVYGQITGTLLKDKSMFEPIKNDHTYQARSNFFLKGVYIKQNDIFKREEIREENLESAAKQLITNLPKKQNTKVIYYELSNLDSTQFKAEVFREVSSRF